MRIRRWAVIALAPAIFGLAACGGKAGDDGVASGGTGKASASASPSQSLDPRDAQLKFAQCMRQNGVNIPDPAPDERGFKITSKDSDRQKVQAAMKKCQQYMQAGGKLGNPNDPKVRDQMLKFAQCMRQHGVDMADPQPGEGIQLRVNKGSQAKTEAAQKACQQYAPGGGAPGGGK